MDEIKIRKLTDHKWINLYNASHVNAKGENVNWIYASRKKEQTPYWKSQADAVVIIPIVGCGPDARLCVIKEHRLPLMDYEWGFPAGLIEDETIRCTIERELKEETGLTLKNVSSLSPPVYSSAGLTDESVQIAIVNTTDDKITTENTEGTEDIQIHLMNSNDIRKLIESGEKIGAKSYPYLQIAAAFGPLKLRSF